MTGPHLIRTPTDIHCVHCDNVTEDVDIWDDLYTGEWAYVYECRFCWQTNDLHGTKEDRP